MTEWVRSIRSLEQFAQAHQYVYSHRWDIKTSRPAENGASYVAATG